MMFQGSRPSAASTTPTRIDSNTSFPITASGGPPRKRLTESVAINFFSLLRLYITNWAALRLGQPHSGSRPLDALQHLLQNFQPVGLRRRLVPAQPADAGKAHCDPGAVA